MNTTTKQNENLAECGNKSKTLLVVVPSDDVIETASIDYRDKSDNENTDKETMMINVNWYDKQEAFQAGVKWFMENYA
jgi:hypothetical protein